jgi:hypothetical protein
MGREIERSPGLLFIKKGDLNADRTSKQRYALYVLCYGN